MPGQEKEQLDSKKMVVSENKLQFTCHLNAIVMGEVGEIGWHLKLESLADKNGKGQGQRKEKEKERIKQPLFQFRYDQKTGRFIREIKENPFIDNACKDPNFVNGQFT